MPRIAAVALALLVLLLAAAPRADAARNITVVPGAGSTGMTGFTATGDNATIGADAITTALAGGDVELNTGATGAQAGTISISAAITSAGPGQLRFVAGGAIIQSAPIAVPNVRVTTTVTAPVTLTNVGNNFGTFSTGVVGGVAVTDANALSLGGSPTSSALSVTSNGSITQTGALNVGGDVTLAAGTGNDIALNDASNDFGGQLTVTSARHVNLRDANDLDLTATTSGNLQAYALDELTAGPLTVGGDLGLNGAPVTAANTANTVVGSVLITSPGFLTATYVEAGDVTLVGAMTGGSLDVTAGDDLAVPAGASVLTGSRLSLIGPGGITLGAGSDVDGPNELRLYSARRGDNAIAADAELNDTTFAPGTEFVDTAREQWGVTAPGGTAALPFTFFYADDEPVTPDPGPGAGPSPTPPTPPAAVAAPPAVVVPKPAPKAACTSRRLFDITIRDSRGRALRSATATLGRTKFKVRRAKGEKASTTLLARLDLRTRPKGKVTIRVTAKTRSGRTVRSTRTFVLCAPPSRS